jgi:hypothetical protein
VISVIIPTIRGREEWLERTIAAYERTTENYELIVLNDFPTCGQAWNAGLLQAKGEYLHLSADDLEPHVGWWEAAVQSLTWNHLPCPRILNTDGSLQSCGPDAYEKPNMTPSDVARIPFFPQSLLEHLYPIFEEQYCGDYWVSWKASQAGWPTLVNRRMVFTHHLVTEGRLHTLSADWDAFQRAIA